MTPDQFRKLGEALYGPRWQSSLAHELQLADRTVRRWAAGNPISKRMEEALWHLCVARMYAIEQAMGAIYAPPDGA